MRKIKRITKKVKKAVIDSNSCISCGSCASECKQEAINVGESSFEVDEKLCIGCEECAPYCPCGAISFVEKDKD